MSIQTPFKLRWSSALHASETPKFTCRVIAITKVFQETCNLTSSSLEPVVICSFSLPTDKRSALDILAEEALSWQTS